MKRFLIGLSVVASFAAKAGTGEGKNDQDARTPASLCQALLASRELDDDVLMKSLDRVTTDLDGLKAAVILVRWLEHDDGYEPRNDRRLRTSRVSTTGATYEVQPTNDKDEGRFAVIAGSRRVVIAEMERLERVFGVDHVTFRRLAGVPLEFKPPGPMTPITAQSIALVETILNHQAAPSMGLYDPSVGEVYYVVAKATMESFRADEFAGTSTGSAANLKTWFTHRLRSAKDDHLIHLPHYAVLSHAAFGKLKALAHRTPAPLTKPTTPALATLLAACLDKVCAVRAPEIIDLAAHISTSRPPSPASTTFASIPDRPLPSLDQFRSAVRNTPLDAASIASFLIDLSCDTTQDHAMVLAQDHALDFIIDRLFASYFPDHPRQHRLLREDGLKLMQGRGHEVRAKRRLMMAFRELLTVSRAP